MSQELFYAGRLCGLASAWVNVNWHIFIVNIGDKEVMIVVVVDKNTLVFDDGHMIEDLEELVNIAAGSHMRLLINEDKAVLVRISYEEDVED